MGMQAALPCGASLASGHSETQENKREKERKIGDQLEQGKGMWDYRLACTSLGLFFSGSILSTLDLAAFAPSQVPPAGGTDSNSSK
jgi:hypothetical protein